MLAAVVSVPVTKGIVEKGVLEGLTRLEGEGVVEFRLCPKVGVRICQVDQIKTAPRATSPSSKKRTRGLWWEDLGRVVWFIPGIAVLRWRVSPG